MKQQVGLLSRFYLNLPQHWAMTWSHQQSKPFPSLICFWLGCFITATKIKLGQPYGILPLHKPIKKYVSLKKETRNTIHGQIVMLLEAELYLKNSIPGGIPPQKLFPGELPPPRPKIQYRFLTILYGLPEENDNILFLNTPQTFVAKYREPCPSLLNYWIVMDSGEGYLLSSAAYPTVSPPVSSR